MNESGLRRTLARRLAPAQCEAAWANVAALLNLSLEMDAGRDATLSLGQESQKSLAAVPPKAHADAVQLLTIHGAKGFGSRCGVSDGHRCVAQQSRNIQRAGGLAEGAEQPVRCAFLQSQSNPPPAFSHYWTAKP